MVFLKQNINFIFKRIISLLFLVKKICLVVIYFLLVKYILLLIISAIQAKCKVTLQGRSLLYMMVDKIIMILRLWRIIRNKLDILAMLKKKVNLGNSNLLLLLVIIKNPSLRYMIRLHKMQSWINGRRRNIKILREYTRKNLVMMHNRAISSWILKDQQGFLQLKISQLKINSTLML